MSHIIYFRFYENGQLKLVDKQQVISCFEPFIQATKDKELWKIVFDKKEQCQLHIGNEMMINCLEIIRPCSSELLAKAILKISKICHLFSLEADLEKLVIYDKKAVDHCPNNLRKEFLENGQFIIIATVENFQNRFD